MAGVFTGDIGPEALLEIGLRNGVFTAASVLGKKVGSPERIEIRCRLGKSGNEPNIAKVRDQGLFDLASLTKVLCVTPCWMLLAARYPRILDRPLSRWFPQCSKDKHCITVKTLLAHCSGLPHWRPYYLYQKPDVDMRSFIWRAILRESLAYRTGDKVLYSDLGFMLLHNILEYETRTPMDDFFRNEVLIPLDIADEMTFLPDPDHGEIIPTRRDEPPGLVNDLNARALGGISGHAGLFGTARAVARIGEEILAAMKFQPSIFDHFIADQFVKRLKVRGQLLRPLGFDFKSEHGSSAGKLFGENSIGHTGFTGVSMWIDPDEDIILVLLTNRVITGETSPLIKEFRPVMGDSIYRELKG